MYVAIWTSFENDITIGCKEKKGRNHDHLTNVCKSAPEWQTYDVIFRAPRCEGKIVRENARMTVFHNSVVIHNNVELPGVTGAPSDTNIQLPGHLRLQDHGDIIWSYK